MQLVEAVESFSTAEPGWVSFKRGQLFYSLSYVPEHNALYVSTMFSTPFAKNAVCGFVPAGIFRPVDMRLLKRAQEERAADAAAAAKHAAKQQQLQQRAATSASALSSPRIRV